MPTTLCVWPSATRGHHRWWRRRPSASGCGSSTSSARRRAASPWTATGNRPSGSIGRLRQGIVVVDEEGHEAPRAQLRLRRPPGERRPLRRRDREHPRRRALRGVLPQRRGHAAHDPRRLVLEWRSRLRRRRRMGFFAGRTADWLRVDGENFPAAPVETIVGRHPDVLLASVYGVPDADSGIRSWSPSSCGTAPTSTAAAFAGWLDAQADLGPKWQPRFARLCRRAPEHADQQDPHPHPRAREVPFQPGPR